VAPAWAACFAATLGWRAGFLAAGVLSFACGVLAATLPRETREHDHDHDHLHAPPRWRDTARALAVTLAGFWNNRRLRWLLLTLVALGFVYRGFLTFLPLHLGQASGGLGAYASYAMSAVLVLGIIAQRYGGELADRRARERLLLVEVAALVPLLALFAFAGGVPALITALAVGFVWALTQPVANALAASYCRPSCHGLLYGIQFALTFAVGSFATTAGGFLLGLGGTRWVFVALAGAALAGAAAAAVVLALVMARQPGSSTHEDSGETPASAAETV
jgi:MFS family permease